MVDITAAEVFRDFVTDGVPSSGPHNPRKPDIRKLLKQYETIIAAFTASGGVIYASKAALDADLARPANTMAWVLGDAVAANNGIFRKVGASGAGNWVRAGDLPYSFILASNVGAGTPSAIQATTTIPVSGSALILLQIAEDYAGAAATVSFNGAAPLTIKTNSGEDVRNLAGGSVVYGVISGGTFRLANDEAIASLIYGARDEAVAAADRADAEADRSHDEADRSEAARDIAAGYASDAVSQGNVPIYATVVGMPSLEIPVGINAIRVNGYYAAGDGGGALYVKVDDEPVHAGKFQTADGAWWELRATEIYPELFGAKVDYTIGGSGTDSTSATQAAADYCEAFGINELTFRPNKGQAYLITGTVTAKALVLNGILGAVVVFKDMAGLVGFDNLGAISVGKTIGARNIEFIVEGANIASAVKGPKRDDQYFIYHTAYRFDGNYCHGANRVVEKYSFAWDYGAEKWFHIGDCVGCNIIGNKVQGAFDIISDPEGQLNDRAFFLDAAGAVLSARIGRNEIGPIWRGVEVGDRAFLTMHDCDLIGTYDGIVWAGTTMFNEPKIRNCNINAQRWGIYVDGPDSLEFTDLTIRRHRSGWKGAAHDWYGMRLANVSDAKISKNTVQPDESAGAFSGVMVGYSLATCSLVSVDGNFVGVGCDIGIDLDNCTGITVDNTVSAQSSASDILFRCITNSRRSVIGQYALVSSFAGTVLSKDASVVDAITMRNALEDIQGTGNIVREVTRVNAGANSKKWRETIGTTALSRSVVDDAGTSTNYEIVSRTGAVVDQIEWRAPQFKFNNGPILKFAPGTPEGSVTGVVGSLHVDTTSGKLYIKATGTGNTGWVVVGTQT